MIIAQSGLGLRVAELLALRVQDIDFLRRTGQDRRSANPRQQVAR